MATKVVAYTGEFLFKCGNQSIPCGLTRANSVNHVQWRATAFYSVIAVNACRHQDEVVATIEAIQAAFAVGEEKCGITSSAKH